MNERKVNLSDMTWEFYAFFYVLASFGVMMGLYRFFPVKFLEFSGLGLCVIAFGIWLKWIFRLKGNNYATGRQTIFYLTILMCFGFGLIHYCLGYLQS